MDSVEISNVGDLPVLGIKYGPLLYEEEAAKIIIGPIKCQAPPMDSWQEFTMEGQLSSLQTGLIDNQNETERLRGQILSFQTEWSQKLVNIKEENDLTLAEFQDKIEKALLPSECSDYKEMSDSKRIFDVEELINPANAYCDAINIGRSDGKQKSQDWDGPGWYRVTGQAGTKLNEVPFQPQSKILKKMKFISGC